MSSIQELEDAQKANSLLQQVKGLYKGTRVALDQAERSASELQNDHQDAWALLDAPTKTAISGFAADLRTALDNLNASYQELTD